jgi:hypothetical protein
MATYRFFKDGIDYNYVLFEKFGWGGSFLTRGEE